LAHDAEERRKTRRTLRAELAGSRLGDAAGLARALEAAWKEAVSAG
jgi:hypothetical protein